jgi:hypothetical protein
MKAFIFDFETLSQNPIDAAVVSCAGLNFDLKIAERNGYTYEELLGDVQFMKFSVKEQVERWNRKIEESTLEWWMQQSKEARASIKPSANDYSLMTLLPWLEEQIDCKNTSVIFTRNNTFDPVIVQSISQDFKQTMPYDWWSIRDTKSFIDGLTYGSGIKDSFIPPEAEGKYVKHDPRHDVVLDVLRLQTILHHKFGE